MKENFGLYSGQMVHFRACTVLSSHVHNSDDEKQKYLLF